MTIGNSILLFVIGSLLTMATIFTIMYFKGVNIKDTKVQNKVFYLSILPFLIALVFFMDISLFAKIITFILAFLAGMLHLMVFDKIRGSLHKRKP